MELEVLLSDVLTDSEKGQIALGLQGEVIRTDDRFCLVVEGRRVSVGLVLIVQDQRADERERMEARFWADREE